MRFLAHHLPAHARSIVRRWQIYPPSINVVWTSTMTTGYLVTAARPAFFPTQRKAKDYIRSFEPEPGEGWGQGCMHTIVKLE
jgi:hypothetical protein